MKLQVWLIRIITFVLVLLLIFLASTVIASKLSGEPYKIFGYLPKIVLSGSMEPTFKTGSIIAIKPGGDLTRFYPGDIITFKMKENVLVTHRVVEAVIEGGNVMYRTKGDHNNSSDRKLVPAHKVIGQYTGFTIPYAGYFFNYISTNWGKALLFIIPGLLLIVNSAISLWRDISELDKNTKQSAEMEETP
jgi:signal peptidase I